ncbi:hypothetical protein E4U55_007100 [Claviceps digitariae]|nr:hypothetical protein E4U55_007100 [Claviceps digitariae]
MALLNPVYAFVVPFLFVVTVPLALLAGVTTTLAFALLISRVIIVYLDVALSFIPQSLARFTSHRRYIRLQDQVPAISATSANSPASSNEDSSRASSIYQQSLLQRRRRRRPSSTVSFLSSGGTATPIGDFGLGLMPSVGPERDFEGIGGWRVGDDDELWTTINSRMELPDRGFIRHHCRTASGGGATTPGGDGGVLMMKTRRRSPEARAAVAMTASSPNSSRTRTPSLSRFQNLTTIGNPDSYFALNPSPKGSKKLPI